MILVLPLFAVDTMVLPIVGLIATDSTLGAVGVSDMILSIVPGRARYTLYPIVAEFAWCTSGAVDSATQRRYCIARTLMARLSLGIINVLVKPWLTLSALAAIKILSLHAANNTCTFG